jgi:hypothetical protein
MEDKLNRILDLLSERNRSLQEELDSYERSEDQDRDLIFEVNLAQIALLEELYEEIKSLK